jgi:hypothetical protein
MKIQNGFDFAVFDFAAFDFAQAPKSTSMIPVVERIGNIGFERNRNFGG